MKKELVVLLAALAFSPLCAAQKWVDEKGRVYYGEPPQGIKVRPAEMKGGGMGIVSSDDLQRQLSQRSQAKLPGRAGKAVEYVPDRQPPRPSQR
jgi:hypothetical protein